MSPTESAPNSTMATDVEPPSRPIGKKRAKDQARRSGPDAYAEAFDIFWAKKKESDVEKESKKQEWYARCYELDKEKVQLDLKRLANEERRIKNEEDRINNEKLAEDKRLKLKEENMQIKRMVEEERIINMDFSTLNENQKEFYTLLQKEILTRRRSFMH